MSDKEIKDQIDAAMQNLINAACRYGKSQSIKRRAALEDAQEKLSFWIGELRALAQQPETGEEQPT